jgi:hypothetical protein
MICKPKDQGGLGILNLRMQKQALLKNNLHKFYNHADIPWVNLVWHAYYDNRGTPQSINTKASFWWKDCIALEDIYKEMTFVDIQNRKLVLLWKDNWNTGIRQDIYISTSAFLCQNPKYYHRQGY